jgi:hypothetical protein
MQAMIRTQTLAMTSVMHFPRVVMDRQASGMGFR